MTGCQVRIHVNESTLQYLKDEDYRVNIIMPIVFHRFPKPMVKFYEHDYSLINTFSWNVNEPEEAKRSPGKQEQLNLHTKHFHRVLSKKDFYNGQVFVCFIKPGIPVDQIVRYAPTYGVHVDTTKHPSVDLTFDWTNGWQSKFIERMVPPQQDLFEILAIPLPLDATTSSPTQHKLPVQPQYQPQQQPQYQPQQLPVRPIAPPHVPAPPVQTTTTSHSFPSPTSFLLSNATSTPLPSIPSPAPTPATFHLHVHMNQDTRTLLKNVGMHMYMFKLIEYAVYDGNERLVQSYLRPMVWLVEEDYLESNEIVWSEEYVAYIAKDVVAEKGTISSYLGWIPLSKKENETVLIQRYQDNPDTLVTVPSPPNTLPQDASSTTPRVYTLHNQSNVPVSGGLAFISAAQELLPLCSLPIPPKHTATFCPTNKVFLCFARGYYTEGTVISKMEQNTIGCIVQYSSSRGQSGVREVMLDDRFGWFILSSLATLDSHRGFEPFDAALKEEVIVVPANVPVASLYSTKTI
jgi:hypothetical protein